MGGLLPLMALLSLAAAGLGLALILAPRRREVGPVELLSLAGLLGTGFVTLGLFAAGLFREGAALRNLVTLACLCVAGLGFRLGRRRLRDLGRRLAAGRAPVWLVSLLALQLGVLVWLSLHSAFGWDGMVVWELKARLACENGGVLPRAYYADPSRQWSHTEYPLLIPMLQVWLYTWLGRCDQVWGKLVYPFFYLLLMGVLYAAAARHGVRRWQGFLGAALPFFVPFLLSGNGSIPSGYSDAPLAVFYVATVSYLLDHWRSRSRGSLAVAGFLGALLPWVKQDGQFLWLCVAGVGLLGLLWRRQLYLLPVLLGPGVAFLLAWHAFRAAVGTQRQDFSPFSVEVLLRNLDRTGTILHYLGRELMVFRSWGYLWLAALVSLVLLALRHDRARAACLGLSACLPLLGYCSVYYFSGWVPFTAHIEQSLPRLVSHVAPLAVLCVALGLPGPRRPAAEQEEREAPRVPREPAPEPAPPGGAGTV